MLALLVLSLIAVVQSPPPRTATLTVRVVERGTNVPLGGVTISATRMASPVERLTAVTEADGTASFVDLRPGRYEVRCHSETHMAIDESLPELGGVAIALPSPPDDQDIFFRFPGVASVVVREARDLHVTFKLQVGAAIVGRVVSPASVPLAADVHLYTYRRNAVLGHPIRETWRNVKTNADGSFELRALQRGTYYVSFRHAHDDTGRLNESFYPGTHDLHDAKPVSVSPGVQVDLGMVELKAVPTVRVSGRVHDNGWGRREILMRRLDISTGDSIQNVLIPVHSNGTFSAPGTDAGVQGLLYTRVGDDGSLHAAATAVVHVGAEPPAVYLKPVLPASISGRFLFDRGYEPVRHDIEPHVYLVPHGPDAWLRESLNTGGAMTAGETFRVDGIVGAHRIDAQAPPGWIVKGFVLDDSRNILDTVFDFAPGKHYANVRVLLSQDAATIEGHAPTLMPPPARRILAFPVEETLWGIWRYQRQAEVGLDGSFRTDSITPGHEYYVAICEWPCASRPEDLEALAKEAKRVYVDRPGVFTVDLGRQK